MGKKIAIALCVLAMVLMAVWKLTEKSRKNEAVAREAAALNAARDVLLIESSDARRFDRNITILGDGWLGYMVFRSRVFQEFMAQHNLGVIYRDEPDFKKRFQALSDGSCDLALGTVDSYLLNGVASGYPGVITFTVDESYGGDAIIARGGIKTIDDLRRPGLKGAFVGFSPSEFLLKSQISHFQLTELAKTADQFRVDEDKEAFRQLKSGAVDFAVLWEPYASRALLEIDAATKVLDSSKLRNLIVDVAIASRSFVVNERDTLEVVTSSYFEALAKILSDESLTAQLAVADSGLPQADALKTLAGIRFTGYRANVNDWFPRRMTRTVEGIQNILLDLGEMSSRQRPTHLVNSGTLQSLAEDTALHKRLISAESPGAAGSLGVFFASLSAEQWQDLAGKATGTLLEQPITFSSGSAEIPEEFRGDLLAAIDKLEHYPHHRLIVQAHVSKGQDPEIDQELSQERAEAIQNFMTSRSQLAPERIHAMGMGSSQLLPRAPGESQRAWKRRCRRARILIAAD